MADGGRGVAVDGHALGGQRGRGAPLEQGLEHLMMMMMMGMGVRV